MADEEHLRRVELGGASRGGEHWHDCNGLEGVNEREHVSGALEHVVACGARVGKVEEQRVWLIRGVSAPCSVHDAVVAHECKVRGGSTAEIDARECVREPLVDPASIVAPGSVGIEHDRPAADGHRDPVRVPRCSRGRRFPVP